MLDFNLAHDPLAVAEDAKAARDGGTLPYMAPEQLDAFLDPGRHGAVREPADLYALGLVLVEMLTGRRPEGPNPDLPLPRAIAELRDRRTRGPIPSARAGNPTVPHALEAIAARCLAPRPEGRYASAADLAEDLSRFLARRPLGLARNPSRPERLVNFTRRNRVGLVAALVLGSIGLAIALTLTLAPARPAARLVGAAGLIEEAVAHEKAGRTAEARRAFTRAEHIDDSNPQLVLSAYRRFAHEYPESASIQAGLGLAYLRDHSAKGAEAAFQRALKAPDRDTSEGRIVARIGLALQAESSGQVAAADEAYERASQALRECREGGAAPELVQRVADIDGIARTAIRLQTLLGSEWLRQKNLNQASEALDTARELEPLSMGGAGYFPLHKAMASLSYSRKNYEDAVAEMTRAIRIAETQRPKTLDGDLADLLCGRAFYRNCAAEKILKFQSANMEPGQAEREYKQAGREYKEALVDIRAAEALGGESPGRAGENRRSIPERKRQAMQGLEFVSLQIQGIARP